MEAPIREHQSEKEDLKRALWKYEREPTRKFGLAFLFFGIVLLVLSIVFASYIIAFLGLGLTFWGALFLFVRPVTYVKSSLLDSAVLSSLRALDGVLTELNHHGNAVYLPPKSLEESKEGILFIAAEKESVMPAAEVALQGKLFMNSQGIRLVPLGQDLVNLFEKELGVNLFKTDYDYLQNTLPRLFTEDLELAKDFEMDASGDAIHVKVKGAAYSNLCSEAMKLTNICPRIGCPFCSAIACALAKATGKAVTIEKNQLDKNETIETWFRLSNVS